MTTAINASVRVLAVSNGTGDEPQRSRECCNVNCRPPCGKVLQRARPPPSYPSDGFGHGAAQPAASGGRNAVEFRQDAEGAATPCEGGSKSDGGTMSAGQIALVLAAMFAG